MAPKRQKRAPSSSSRAFPPPPPRVDEDSPEFLGIHFTNKKHLQVFNAIKKRKLLPTRYLDFVMLDTLGFRRDIEWLAERLGWQRFIHLRETAYKGLTLEFLSTLDSQVMTGPRSLDGLCTFRLGNVDRELVLADVREIFGFPALVGAPRGETRVHFCNTVGFWDDIGSGHYNPTRTKASGISNPALRVFHRFMAHTIFGRGEGGENSASKKEVIFLCAALEGHPVCSAGFLMQHLSLTGNKLTGEIAIGGLVTRIARHFGIDLDQRRDGILPLPIGITLLQKMKLLYSYRDIWYWEFPSSEEFPQRKQLIRLPCPDRISLLQRPNWKLIPLPSDPSHEHLRASRPSGSNDPMEDDVEDVDDDEQADQGPIASDPRLYAMLESMQRDMTTNFSNLNNRITLLHEKVDGMRAYGWQPGPPPPPPQE